MSKFPKYPIHGSKYFDVREFVHPTVWKIFGVRAAMFVDPKNVRIADVVRERYGSATINDWMFGGKRVASGFRAPWEKIGGEYSQHRFGRANDSRCKNATPQEIYEDILKNPMPFYEAGLTRIEDIEDTPTWLHLDCAPVPIEPGKFMIVKPSK
jgi:hypothetical protein